ncbi:MAG TPA: glycosyltransferase family 2 protein [Terriglobia bacterium]|jgi:glycosyltransferase involved in cell wall biosynthesis|nr:glycosyltransferase family 2 protein [Terriglobia bacterium]
MKPLVSILIPAFNAQEWIADTLRSALAQTWPHKEIIVVDDGSSDSTPAILQQFESRGVTVAAQPNQGAAAARNEALSLSSGEYIQWLDADDLLAPDKISRQMEVLGERPDKRILVSSAWGRFMYRYQRARFLPTSLWRDLPPAEWLMRQMEENIYMQTATWLVSRELAEAAGSWDTRLLGDDDGEYFSRVLLASCGTRFVPEGKVYYRMAGTGSLSYVGRSELKREAQWLSMKLHVHYLLSVDDSARARAACVTYLQTWMVFFYPERLDIFAEACELARQLGGRLEVPRLSWKYAWIKSIFGWPLARRAQSLLPQIRSRATRFCDRAISQIENRRLESEFPI